MTVEGRGSVSSGGGNLRGLLLAVQPADLLHVVTDAGEHALILMETATPYLADPITRSGLLAVLRRAWKHLTVSVMYDWRRAEWACCVGTRAFRAQQEVQAMLLALQACNPSERVHWMRQPGGDHRHDGPSARDGDGRVPGAGVGGGGVPDPDSAAGTHGPALADTTVSGQPSATSAEASEARRAALIEECNTIRERLASVNDLSWTQIQCLGRIDAWIGHGAVERTYYRDVREHHIRATFKALIRRGLITYRPVRLTDYGREVATSIRRMEEIRAMRPIDLRPETAP